MRRLVAAAAVVVLSSSCQCGDVRLGAVFSRLEVDPQSVDFGTVPVGAQAAQAVTFTNTSAVAITIDTLEVTGGDSAVFDAVPSGGPFTLKAGASLVVDVIYQPLEAGAHAARLTLRSGASSAPELLVPLAGNTGVAASDGGQTVEADAGVPHDAGAVVDAGVTVVDAGVPFDAGLPELDAGPPCSELGTCCPDGLFRQGTDCVGAADLATGATHACAVVDGGTVKCWGEATHGQLGVGVFATRSLKPVTVPGLVATQIRAAEAFTCALTPQGTVWCWGDNSSGQLGNGSTASSAVPVQVQGLFGVTDVALGSGFACARVATGEARCWGRNDFRQLGVAGGNRSTPVTVIGGDVARLSVGAGDGHACATLSSGVTRCWGYNGWGQLGDGTTNSPLSPVVAVNAPMGATVTVGVSSGCSVTTAGVGACWGNNDHGQLGSGSKATAPQGVGVTGVTTPQVVSGGPWRALSATSRFHGCGLTTSGGVKCWGKERFTGDGTTSERLVPVDVVGLTSGVSRVSVGGLAIGVSSGLAFTCALRETGGVACWGDNGRGQLGNGTAAFALAPTFVTDL